MHWLWIVPLVLLIIFLASPRFRGDVAETRTRRILAAGLEKNRYTILNDVVIPSGGGTVHIDHVIVSKFGLFVIESQYASGWVSGGEFQERWKQYHWRRFSRFENPMHRNALQAQALQNLLKIPSSKIHSMVVMVGQRGFKTPMPANLLEPEKLIAAMRKKAHQLLEADQADRLLRTIEDARIQPGGGMHISKWSLLNVFLIIALLAGLYLAFGDDLARVKESLTEKKARQDSPEMFKQDGSRKSEQELWEDALVCAYSLDTGRCACYEPNGTRVDIETEKCRSLAERGSILKQ